MHISIYLILYVPCTLYSSFLYKLMNCAVYFCLYFVLYTKYSLLLWGIYLHNTFLAPILRPVYSVFFCPLGSNYLYGLFSLNSVPCTTISSLLLFEILICTMYFILFSVLYIVLYEVITCMVYSVYSLYYTVFTILCSEHFSYSVRHTLYGVHTFLCNVSGICFLIHRVLCTQWLYPLKFALSSPIYVLLVQHM